jgi:hypothetical protein
MKILFKEVYNYNIVTMIWVKINTNSTVDLQSVLENYGAEILNVLNSVKNVLKWPLMLHFIPMKLKELLAETFWGGLIFNKIETAYMSSFLVSLFTDIFSFLVVIKWEMSSFPVIYMW